MSEKTITISVHEDDTRRLALASLSFISARFLSKYSNKMEELENLIGKSQNLLIYPYF